MHPFSHCFISPLRYPGGKRKLANFSKLLISNNNLLKGHYVEVYAGGASIAWSLLFEEYVQHVHINDLSKSIYAFWKSVFEATDDLCALINDTPVAIKEWKIQKAIQTEPDKHPMLDLGFSTFFLNRTNWSGIITGGIIGGKKQIGKYKIDARFNKPDLIARIQRIATYSNRVSIYNEDASDFIRHHLKKIPKRSFVYLDPPYYAKGEDLYTNYYCHQDHMKIGKLVTEHIKQPWMVSYNNVPKIVNAYKNYRKIHYDLNYSAQKRYEGSEIIIFSKDLLLPKVNNPARVNKRMMLSA